MRVLIKFILILGLISSCKSIEDIKLQSRLLDNKGIVVEVNEERNYIVIMWQCANRPYKNQPCFGYSEHPLHYFENVFVGDTLKVGNF